MASFEEELERSGKLIYRNAGVSMRPLIKQNRDILIITKPEGRLKKYDIPLYKRGGNQYVLHRIVKVRDNDSLVRKGKEVNFNGFGYRFYTRFWYAVYPVRVIFMEARILAGKIKRKLTGKCKTAQ